MPLNKVESPNIVEAGNLDELLGKAPPHILRWGIMLFLGILLLVLGVCWFIKYPDKLSAEINLYEQNMPVTIISKTGGKIIRIFADTGNIIQANEPVLLLENSANYNDIIQLQKTLDSLKPYYEQNKLNTIPTSLVRNKQLILGDLQPVWAQFDKTFSDYTRARQLALLDKKISALRRQLYLTRNYFGRISKQDKLMAKDLTLSENEYKRDSTLNAGRLISASEYERTQSQFIQKQYSVEGSKISITNTEIQLAQLEQQIIDLQLQKEEQEQQFLLTIRQNYESLCNQLRNWKQMYLIYSPIAGKVMFTKFWSINQQVNANDKVVTIIPVQKSRIYGRIQLPVQGAGKVKPNQKVLIKLNDYPSTEYGVIEGKIASVSPIPEDKAWTLEIELPSNLKTTYNKKLPLKNGMIGQAEIITQEMRLIERFFNPLKDIFHN